MSDVKIVVNTANVGTYLLKSDAVASMCASLAPAAAAHVGLNNYTVGDTYNGTTRINVEVHG